MMAVSLPTSVLNNMDSNKEVDNEDQCVFGSKDCYQSISKENLDKIRATMMRHEALFKEQVQTLHKLYNMQKTVMQEIRKMICSQAQILPFCSDMISDREGQLLNIVADGKTLRQVSITSQADMEESHVFPVRPICAVKEFTGCDAKMSSWMNNAEVQSLPSGQNNPRKEIDLERLPEDYMDEFEIQNGANRFETPDTNTCLSEETRKTIQVSCIGSNLSALTESPNLNQKGPISDIVTLVGSQGNAEKQTMGVQSLNKASQDDKLNDYPCNYLPAAPNSLVYEESNPSFNQHAEKPLWLHQGTSQNSVEPIQLHTETNYEQVKGCTTPGPTQVYQSLESNCLVRTSHLKLDEIQQNNSANGHSVSTIPAIFPESSLTLKHCDSKSSNNMYPQGSPSPETESISGKQTSFSWGLTYQTSEDGGNEDPNCSGYGSNSMDSHSGNVCKDGNLSIFTVSNDPKFGANFSEPVQMSQVAVDGIQSEHEEALQFTNIGVKPCVSSSVAGSETNHMDHGHCSNDSHGNLASQEEPVVVTEISENPENVSTLEEACESIAAKILLSFAPCRSQDHTKGQDFQHQMEVESNISSRDVSRQSLCMRSSINYNAEGFINETVNWTKSVHGRRSSRRPR